MKNIKNGLTSKKTKYSSILLIIAFIFSSFSIIEKTYAETKTFETRITLGNENEERLTDGYLSSSSSDIDLGEDNNTAHTPQITGFRFPVAIPKNTLIKNAYIQFTARLVNTESTSLIINGEAIDNAPGFINGITHNLSLRTKTMATVIWNDVPAWNLVGERGLNQRTPNISSLVQEIINRDGWMNNNTMVFMIRGTGTRNTPKTSATLYIEYDDAQSASGSGSGANTDTQAPTIPTNLAARSVTHSSIDLNWTAANDNIGVVGYRVYRNGTRIATVTSLSYLDTGLVGETIYSYQISAIDAAGNESNKSAILSVTTLKNESPLPMPTNIGLIWNFFGDSETAGRATDTPSVLSPSIAFQTIWRATYPTAISSRYSNGVSGSSLLSTLNRYISRGLTRNSAVTWLHFQESGGQNSDGERTPEEFGNTFEQFVRTIRQQSKLAVISTETAYSFQRESTAYRNWTQYNVELKSRVAKLQSEGITVKVAEVDENIKTLVDRLGFSTVITTDGGHFRGVGNLLVALLKYKSLGYDVNSLNLGGIPNTEVSAENKKLCLDIVNASR